MHIVLLCEYTMFFLTKNLFIGGFPVFTFTKRLRMNIHIAKCKLGVITYDEFRERELLFQVYTVGKTFDICSKIGFRKSLTTNTSMCKVLV